MNYGTKPALEDSYAAKEAPIFSPADELRNHAVRVMDEVLNTICGPRIETYGPPQQSFEQIAEFWDTYLRRRGEGPLRGRDVANMMQLMKISRNAVVRSHDNIVDIIGYAIIEEIL